jgi:hypothetical protein
MRQVFKRQVRAPRSNPDMFLNHRGPSQPLLLFFCAFCALLLAAQHAEGVKPPTAQAEQHTTPPPLSTHQDDAAPADVHEFVEDDGGEAPPIPPAAPAPVGDAKR